jgi:hypothetical protein
MMMGVPNDGNIWKERIAPAVVSALTAVAELPLGPQEAAGRSFRSWSTEGAVTEGENEERTSERLQDQLVRPSIVVTTARQDSYSEHVEVAQAEVDLAGLP